MSWHGIHGHDDVLSRFRRAIARQRLASSFLFAGPAGIGKRCFAMKLAQALLCSQRADEDLDPCGSCPDCVQVTAGTHPDVDVVAKPDDRATIPLDLLIGDKEHRGREGMCHRIGLKPYAGSRKIGLVDGADHLNVEGANCLLKTLEEPPPRSMLILIGTSPARQLPTIRSRCQLIRFRPLSADVLAELLISQDVVQDPAEAQRLALYCDGSLRKAIELANADLWEFRAQLHQRLAEPIVDSVRLSKAVAAFVDEAGKQPAARRGRLRQTVAFAAEFYRHLLHARCGAARIADLDLQTLLTGALKNRQGNRDATAECLERCLEAAGQIDRNANQSTLIETWLDDLAKMSPC